MSAVALSASACSVNDDLADAGVHDARLLDAVLDLAALGVLDGVADVERDRADLRVRHEAARTEDATELADGAHHVGRRDDAVEVHEPFGDLRDQVVAAGEIGAGLAGLALFLALGEHEDAHGLARSRAGERARRGPSDRRAWDSRPDGPRGRPSRRTWRTSPVLTRAHASSTLYLRARSTMAVDLRAVLGDFRHFPPLSACSASHRASPRPSRSGGSTQGRWEQRLLPSLIHVSGDDVDAHRARGAHARCGSADSMSVQFMSGIFCCGELAHLLHRDLADLDLVRLLRARARLLARRRGRRPS